MPWGEWMNQFGESIYGTRGGPLAPQAWGVTTQTDDAVYLHILSQVDGALYADLEGVDIDKITNLSNGETVKFHRSGSGYLIEMPEQYDEFLPVLVLKATREKHDN